LRAWGVHRVIVFTQCNGWKIRKIWDKYSFRVDSVGNNAYLRTEGLHTIHTLEEVRMSRIRVCRPSLPLITLTLFLCTAPAIAQNLNYPKSHKGGEVDTYFGVPVVDPYRWLEDEKSPETAEWVKEQNALTFDYLGKIPFRSKLKE